MAGEAGLYGAVEGGGSKFLCALADESGKVVATAQVPTRDAARTLGAVQAFFAPHRGALVRLGVACFGPLALVGESRGTLLRTPKPGWSGVAVSRALEDALAVPVEVDTDVHGALLAESRWGALRGAESAAYVTVGTGVGVGVMVNGARVYGRMHPELGHAPAHDPEFEGMCSFHGSCVEGLVSAPALRARAGMPPESLPDDHPLWARVARVLGGLLQTIALAYAPERIALGGGVLARTGLREASAQAFLERLGGYLPWPELTPHGVERYVVAPALGAEAGLYGGFALAGLDVLPRFE
jgi:fructokinase